MEIIKPKLIEQYEKKTTKIVQKNVLPIVPNNRNNVSVSISEETDNTSNSLSQEDAIIKATMMADLEMRWSLIVPKRELNPEPVLKPDFNKPGDVLTECVASALSIPNTVRPTVSKPINQPLITDSKSKTTDDIDKLNKKSDKIVLDNHIIENGCHQKPLDAFTILKKHLATRGLMIVDVPGDNNCQFHAIADQFELIDIKGWNAKKLRKKAVRWLKDNGNRPMDDGKIGEQTLLKDAIGVPVWDNYIKEMSKDSITWGDEATLLALSVLFKVEIFIISSLSDDYCHSVKPPELWKVEMRSCIYLGHYHEFHYVSTKSNL